MKKTFYKSFFKNSDIHNVIPITFINTLYKKQDLDKLEIIDLQFQEIFSNRYFKFLLYNKWYVGDSDENYPEWFHATYSYYKYICRKFKLNYDTVIKDKQLFFLFCYIGWNLRNIPKIQWKKDIFKIVEKYHFQQK